MYATKTWLRRPLAMLLWVFVLTAACALLCTGMFTYISAKKTTDDIDEQFTTVAVLKERDFNPDGTVNVANFRRAPQEDTFKNNKSVIVADNRRYQSAYSEGATPLLSAMVNKAYNKDFDEPYGAMMLRVTMLEHSYTTFDDEPRLHATIKVDEVIFAHPGYELADTVIVYCTADHEPVIDGESYILFGEYYANDLVWDAGDEMDVALGLERDTFPPAISVADNVPAESSMFTEDGTLAPIDPSEYDDVRLPLIAPITGETEDFLAAPENEIWAKAVERYEITLSSMPLLGTDCIESMLMFNIKTAELAEGRFFTEKEYKNGELVCVISDAFAEINGLNVGDKLALRPYFRETEFTPTTFLTSFHLLDKKPSPLIYDLRVGFEGDEREFTIVGLYHTSSGWLDGTFNFNPNTIFVPNSTIQGEYQISDEGVMYSLRLKNGSKDAFRNSLVGTEFENQFVIYDQGYSQMQKTIEQLNSNALILVSLGGAAFVAVALLYVLLNIGGQKHIYGTMRSLGQTEENVAKFATGSSLLPLIVVLPLSCIVTYALLGVVKEKLLLGYDANIVWVIPIVAVVEGLLLAAFVGGYCRKIMKANPLALMKEVK